MLVFHSFLVEAVAHQIREEKGAARLLLFNAMKILRL